MKRLTKKAGKTYKYNFDTNCDFEIREQRSIETHNKIVDKLGQLEDNEEELGIDLITLFKALKNGIYFKVGDKVYFTNGLELDFEKKVLFEFGEYGDYEIYEINEYGETWALTKEELECQQ